MSMDPNPYASSAAGAPGMGGFDPSYAQNKVNAPALSMMIVAGISIAVRIVMLGFAMLGAGVMAAGAANQGNDANAALAAGQAVGGLVGNVIGIALNGLIVFGAMKMRNLQSYGLAMTAAVLSVIPCCSPCLVLGIPFGIWSLIVLNDPLVKSAFRP